MSMPRSETLSPTAKDLSASSAALFSCVISGDEALSASTMALTALGPTRRRATSPLSGFSATLTSASASFACSTSSEAPAHLPSFENTTYVFSSSSSSPERSPFTTTTPFVSNAPSWRFRKSSFDIDIGYSTAYSRSSSASAGSFAASFLSRNSGTSTVAFSRAGPKNLTVGRSASAAASAAAANGLPIICPTLAAASPCAATSATWSDPTRSHAAKAEIERAARSDATAFFISLFSSWRFWFWCFRRRGRRSPRQRTRRACRASPWGRSRTRGG